MPAARSTSELKPAIRISAYASWAARLTSENWTPYLLTFMFRALRGSARNVARTMEDEIERVYSTHVTRVHRDPTAPSAWGHLPVWICSPDYPVAKRQRASVAEVSVNDGRHYHAVAFMPPASQLRKKLRGPLNDHFAQYAALYVREPHPLLRIHVEPVTHEVGRVVSYALKAFRGERVGGDDVLLLPRHRDELIDAPPRRGNTSIFARSEPGLGASSRGCRSGSRYRSTTTRGVIRPRAWERNCFDADDAVTTRAAAWAAGSACLFEMGQRFL